MNISMFFAYAKTFNVIVVLKKNLSCIYHYMSYLYILWGIYYQHTCAIMSYNTNVYIELYV